MVAVMLLGIGLRRGLHASVEVTAGSWTRSWWWETISQHSSSTQGTRHCWRQSAAEWWRYCHCELCQTWQKVCVFCLY